MSNWERAIVLGLCVLSALFVFSLVTLAIHTLLEGIW